MFVCMFGISGIVFAYDPMDYQKTLMQYNQISGQYQQWQIQNQQNKQMLQLMQQQVQQNAQQGYTSPVTPAKMNDQICSEYYKNTKWYGKYGNEGSLECDCKSGYTWNSGRTSCIAPVVTKTHDQSCKEFNAVWSSDKQYCVCKDGDDWSNSKCVAKTSSKDTEGSSSVASIDQSVPVKKIGFFRRLIGWFK